MTSSAFLYRRLPYDVLTIYLRRASWIERWRRSCNLGRTTDLRLRYDRDKLRSDLSEWARPVKLICELKGRLRDLVKALQLRLSTSVQQLLVYRWYLYL